MSLFLANMSRAIVLPPGWRRGCSPGWRRRAPPLFLGWLRRFPGMVPPSTAASFALSTGGGAPLGCALP